MKREGFDYVVHCFTESDLLDGLEAMRAIVHMSHEIGLEVQVDPWGLAGVFGGEAFSKFTAWENDACQVLADGSWVGVACLWHPKLRAFVHRWIDAAIDIGTDVMFWDEPHWYPGDLWYFGEPRGDDAARWSCRCGICQERFRTNYGHEMPADFTDEVIQFRIDAVLDMVKDCVSYSSGRDVRQTVCLLPHGQFHKLVNLPDWAPFASLPEIDTFGTDAYWRVSPPIPMEPFLTDNAIAVREMCERFGKVPQFWIQGYNFPAGREWEAAYAIKVAVENGMTDLPVWAYRGCEAMSRLWPESIDKTWSTIVQALARAKAGEEVIVER